MTAARKARRRLALPADTPADLGTPERARQQGGIVLELREIAEGGAAKTRGARVRYECVLDAYRGRAMLDDREYDAGMRLRALAYRAGAIPRTTAQYREPLNSRGDPIAAVKATAADDLRHALREIGPMRSAPVVAVCVMDEWAGNSRRLDHLREGLGILAKLWGV